MFSLSSVPIVPCPLLCRMQLFFMQKLVTFGEIMQGFATLENFTFLTLRYSEYKKTNNLRPTYACTCNMQKFLHYNNHHNLPTLLYFNFISHYKHSYTNSPSVIASCINMISISCCNRFTFEGGETVFAQICSKLIPGNGSVSKRLSCWWEGSTVGPTVLTGSWNIEDIQYIKGVK